MSARLLNLLLTWLAFAAMNAFAQVDLTGDWTAIRNGAVVAKCSIKQNGEQLEFVIHREPVERSKGRFLNATTVVASDWGEQATIAEGGNLLRWRNSEWRRAAQTTAQVDLTGDWTAIRNGAVVARCSIKQNGEQLEFVIHREPVERSKGRFLNATTVIASDWGEQATIAEGGNLLRWRNSEWKRAGAAGGTAGGIGLNGCWNKCGVQLYQEGERVYYSASWKNAPGEWRAGWVIQRGEGWLRGQELYLHDVTWPSVLLNGAPSPKTEYYMRLSSDGNVLQGYAVVNGQKGPILTWTRDK